MNRADLVAHIDAALPGYKREFFAKSLQSTAWNLAVDNALRTAGYTELSTPTIPSTDEPVLRALAVYFALEAAERVAASRVTISVGNPPSSKAAGDAYARIRQLRIEQGRIVSGLGITLASGTGMQLVTVPVRYLEQVTEEDL